MTEDKFEVKLNKGVISIWEDDVKCILVADNKKVDIGTIVHILNKQDKEIKELTEEKNYFERAYQEFIEFADKKAKELGYPSFCTDVINEIITQKEME